MDAARKHWGSFEGFVAYVTGPDETATRQLEKVICDRWETGYQVERAEWENHQSGGEQPRLEYYRKLAAEGLASGKISRGVSAGYKAWYGFTPLRFSAPQDYIPKSAVAEALAQGKLPPVNLVKPRFRVPNVFTKWWPSRQQDGPQMVCRRGRGLHVVSGNQSTPKSGDLPYVNDEPANFADRMQGYMINALQKWNKYPNIKMKDTVSEDHPLYFDFISYEFGAWVYAYLINKVADPDVLLEIFHPNVGEFRW